MNPSYGNGFGSFGSGGAMPGGMPSGSGGAMPGGMPGAGGAMPSGSGGMVPGGVPGVAPGAGGGAPGVVPGSGVPGSGGAMPGGMPGAGGGMPAGSFGGGMPGNIAPISSGTGDVVLGGGAEKKSHKGLFIGMAVMLVILIIGGVVVAMVMGNGGWGAGRESARDKFNKLVNYVVSGETLTSNYNEAFNDEASYYFDTQQTNLENREALYTTTSALLDDFMNSYNKLTDKSQFSSDAEQFEEIMNSEKEVLSFARVVGIKEVPTTYDMLDVYDRETTLVQQFGDYYDFSNMENSVYTDEFKSVFDKYIDAQSRRIKIYDDKECVSGSTIKSDCVTDDDILAPEYNALVDELKVMWVELEDYYNIADLFTVRLFRANELLNNQNAVFVEGAFYA